MSEFFFGLYNGHFSEVASTETSQENGEKGMPRLSFESILQELNDMQIRKGNDYGSDLDPLANICSSKEFGIPPWLGAVLRANDKMARIKTFATRGTLSNESVEDSLMDMAVCAIHALRLFREQKDLASCGESKSELGK